MLPQTIDCRFLFQAEPSLGLDSADDCRSSPTRRVRLAPGALASRLARRPLSTTKGEKARQPAPRCRLVETAKDHPYGLVSVAPGQVGQVFSVFTSNRERAEFASSSPHNAPDGLCKKLIGGFHGVSLMLLRQTSSLGALEQ